MTRGLALLGCLLAASALAHAHDPGISTAEGRVRAGTIELVAGFAPADAQQFVPSAARTTSRRMTAEEFSGVRTLLEAVAPKLWEAHAAGAALVPRETGVQLLPGDSVSFRVVFPLPPGVDKITLRATQLAMLPPGHRQFVIISDAQGMTLAKKLLRANDDTLETPCFAEGTQGAAASASAETPPTFWGFVRLGIEHIWTGYDHLLFLFALLVVCRSFRSIVAIITCFTLAHSTTLALATLNVVNLPSRFTEPAIAATIVFVGVENLLRRGAEPRGRWALTFGFGLIHGFGFASVLRELGVGENGTSIALPLFTFNAGVELGQVAVAAIVLPLVWRLRKNETFVTRGVPALSAVVSLAGLYWFLERTVFS